MPRRGLKNVPAAKWSTQGGLNPPPAKGLSRHGGKLSSSESTERPGSRVFSPSPVNEEAPCLNPGLLAGRVKVDVKPDQNARLWLPKS